ncbi:MAG: hypothetical protein SNG79_01310 [Rikenellaceae bacterium]
MTPKGFSYALRVKAVNDIYDRHARSGLSNREIWRRYIWPEYAISEKTFYNYINASVSPTVVNQQEALQQTLFEL